MAIDLFVQRGAGDLPGDDVIDPLVTSIPVALARGRNELDARAHAKHEVELEAVYRGGLRIGELVRDTDLQALETWTGEVSGITHQIRRAGDSVQLSTTLRIERPIAA